MRRSILGLVGVLALAPVVTAQAQVQRHRFQVGPRAAWLQFPEKSGLKDAGLFGMDALYYLNGHLGVGFSLDFSRPQTNGPFFPAEFTFGDTTFIYQATYPLTTFQYQVLGIYSLSSGRFSPYLVGGAGQYTLFIDPQASQGQHNVTHGMFTVGGGLNVRLGQNSGLRFEVRDFLYSGYDLNEVNNVKSRFAPRRFPDVAPVPDNTCYRETCRLSNLQFAFGFTFVPGGR
jgi:hypothetical protein